MVKLPTNEFQELVPKLREKGFYKSQEPRRISWPEYNFNQINHIRESLIFIRDSVDDCEAIDLSGRVGRPLTDPKELAKAILVSELFGLPERQA